jgi:hypothetical protein
MNTITLTVTIATTCPECNKQSNITVTRKGYDKYIHGELIQRAFPELNANQKEMIKSGICQECWDIMFADEETIKLIDEQWADEPTLEDIQAFAKACASFDESQEEQNQSTI